MSIQEKAGEVLLLLPLSSQRKPQSFWETNEVFCKDSLKFIHGQYWKCLWSVLSRCAFYSFSITTLEHCIMSYELCTKQAAFRHHLEFMVTGVS